MKKSKQRKIKLSPRLFCSLAVIVLKVASVALSLAVLTFYVPYFYIAVRAAAFLCVLRIVASSDNPDYKIPWLLLIMIAPGVGFILYLMFYSRIMPLGYLGRLKAVLPLADFSTDDSDSFSELALNDPVAMGQAMLLCSASASHLYSGMGITYLPSGEEMLDALLEDICKAEESVYLEYYIIKEGSFLDRITAALSERAAFGVDVRLLYDDFGSLGALPRGFSADMARKGIIAVPFSRLCGRADSGFNNRNHRKIAVIDGKIAYTGGVNIGDEYIGRDKTLGRWKDSAVRLEGSCVRELLRLFVIDYGVNVKNYVLDPCKAPKNSAFPELAMRKFRFKKLPSYEDFCIPFGDGPRPLYTARVSRGLLLSMLGSAIESVHITTPYLVIDTELFHALEGCAARGIDVRIIIPEIPDKRAVSLVGEGITQRLIRAGVKVYRYTDGFIHAKTYLVDGKYMLLGSINLDNRSLAYNFECGVWIYSPRIAEEAEADFEHTLNESKQIFEVFKPTPLHKKIIRSILSIFSPLF